MASLGSSISFGVLPALDETAVKRITARVDELVHSRDIDVRVNGARLESDLKKYNLEIARLTGDKTVVVKARTDLAAAKLALGELSAEAKAAGEDSGGKFGTGFSARMRAYSGPGGLWTDVFAAGLTALPKIAAGAAAVAAVAGAAALGVVFTAAVIKLDPAVGAAGKSLGTSLGNDFITGTKKSGFDTALIKVFGGLKTGLAGPIESIADTLGKTFLPALKPVENGIITLAGYLAKNLPGAIATAKDYLGRIDWVKIGQDIGKIATTVGQIIVPAFQGWESVLKPVVGLVVALLVPVVEWLAKNPALVSSIAAIAAGLYLFNKALGVVRLAVIALDIVSDANPWVLLGLAIVAVTVLVIKYWGPISKFFIDVWNHIYSGFVTPLVNFFTQTIPHTFNVAKDFITRIWGDIWNFFKDIWGHIENVFTGAFKSIQNWLSTAWNTIKSVTSAIWNAILTILKDVWKGIKLLFEDGTLVGLVITHWNAIKSVTASVWNAIFGFFKSIWGNIENVFTGAFKSLNNWISTAWNAIKSVTSRLWGDITGAISGAWTTVKNDASAALSWVTSKISGVWADIKSDAKTGWDDIVSAVSTAWGALESVVKAPVKFVVNTIYNEGLVPLWNDTGGLVGLPKLKPLTLNWASGGIIPGYAPGIDNVPAMLSRGEAVLNPGAAKALGHDNIRSLNASHMPTQGVSQAVSRYAAGGVAGDPPLTVIPGAPGAGVGGQLQQVNTDPNSPDKGLSQKTLGTDPVAVVGKYARDIAAHGLSWVFSNLLNPLISQIPGTSGHGPLGQLMPTTMKKIESSIISFIQGNGNGQPDSGGSAGPLANVSAGTEAANARSVFNYLVGNLGFNGIAAAGAIGSMAGEANFNPELRETGDYSAAFSQGQAINGGIMGWSPLHRVFNVTSGVGPGGSMQSQVPDAVITGSPSYDLSHQIKAIGEFLTKNGDWGAVSRMKNAGSINAAAQIWESRVERAGISDVHGYGLTLAESLLNNYKAGTVTKGDVTTQKGTSQITTPAGTYAAGGIVGQIQTALTKVQKDELTVKSLEGIKKPTRSESLSLAKDKLTLSTDEKKLGALQGTSAADAVAAAKAKLADTDAAADQARILKLAETYSHAQLESMVTKYTSELNSEYTKHDYAGYAGTAAALADVQAAIARPAASVSTSQLSAQHDAIVAMRNTAQAAATKAKNAGDLKGFAAQNQKVIADNAKISAIDSQISATTASSATAATGLDPLSAMANALSSKGYLKSISAQLLNHSLDPAPVAGLSHADMTSLALNVTPDSLQSLYDNDAAGLVTALKNDLVDFHMFGDIGKELKLLGKSAGVHGMVSGLAFKSGGTLSEKVLGVGQSTGRSFSFGAGEHVTKAPVVNAGANPNAETNKLLAENNRLLAENTRVTAESGNQTNKALGSVGQGIRF